ncbi:cobalamin B12-binding domain-containing protein [Roseicyclus sp.]|uniref:cobalamin B12-binding domain-containing protein n=1 Tax=Roseicyclus sp. TaxID=1914329 RepID=UPI003F6C5EED
MTILGDPCAAAMAFALCDPDDCAAQFLVDDLLEAGISVEDLCHDHLAPAARRLGTLWDRDRIPFTDVALATARIQSILRRLPGSRANLHDKRGLGAIFAAVPGEMHTLGVMMAADLFRRGGWDISLLVGLTHDELLARLTRDDRPVIGLSCSGEHSFGALRRLLAALGNARPDAQFLVSGQIIADPARIAALPVPVMVVGDLDSAEAEMARLDAVLSSSKLTRLRPARGRSASMA